MKKYLLLAVVAVAGVAAYAADCCGIRSACCAVPRACCLMKK